MAFAEQAEESGEGCSGSGYPGSVGCFGRDPLLHCCRTVGSFSMACDPPNSGLVEVHLLESFDFGSVPSCSYCPGSSRRRSFSQSLVPIRCSASSVGGGAVSAGEWGRVVVEEDVLGGTVVLVYGGGSRGRVSIDNHLWWRPLCGNLNLMYCCHPLVLKSRAC
jgi:hypothetical protein